MVLTDPQEKRAHPHYSFVDQCHNT